MMLLRDYLQDNVLISNTHSIFNYDLFKQRMIVRYGAREIRDDMPVEYISVYAQNTIDINTEYFKFLFSNVVNPFETWAETETHGENGENTKTGTTGGTKNLGHTGTITTTDSGTVNNTISNSVTDSNTAHNENPTTSKTSNNVNAYNSQTAVPRDNTETINTNTSDSNYNGETKTTGTNGEIRDLTNTQTFANSDNETTTGTNNEQNNFSNTGNYTKSGYNINDFQTALLMQYNAYDTIIDCVIRDILIIVADVPECDFMWGAWL